MKVYIVTDGSYSDYDIKKVFSNRSAAEEYKKWINIRNDIEEWEIHDEPFSEEDGERAMFIRVFGHVYPEAVVNIRYNIEPRMLGKYIKPSGAGIGDINRYDNNSFYLHIYKYIPADKWDEEKYKDRLTKALYDYAAIVKHMLAEGASVDMVNKALMNEER